MLKEERMIMRKLDLDVVVVGGGIAGLTCAQRLRQGGATVTVLDKGRAPGGRAVSRREGRHLFEHGAPGEQSRLLGLVADTDVISLQEVRTLLPDPRGGWRIAFRGGRLAPRCDHAIVAVPPRQAAALLSTVPSVARTLAAVTMDSCLTALVALAGPSGATAAELRPGGRLLELARRQDALSAPAGGEAWVLHATAAASDFYLEDDPDLVASRLLAEFAACLPMALPDVVLQKGHRWRHARTRQPLGRDCLDIPKLDLGLCGDWCRGRDVNDAVVSGIALAERVLARRGGRMVTVDGDDRERIQP